MASNLKKPAAIPALILSFLTLASSAFCTGEKGKLDKYSALIVGKYFESNDDLVSLMMTGKKFGDLAESYKFNPTPYDPKLYPNIETYVAYRGEKASIDRFTDKVRTLVYTAGSFNSVRYREILEKNNVTCDWRKRFLIDNATGRCKIIFKKRDRMLAFYFDPFKSAALEERLPQAYFQIDRSISYYNIFLNMCGFRYCLNSFCFKYNFKKFDIPKTAVKLDYMCFDRCTRLKDVTIPNTVIEIGDAAFAGCEEIDKIDIPNSVTSIGKCAFDGCRSLESITIPDSVVEIKNEAFRNCISLRSIKIPDSVEKICDDIFKGDTLNHIEYKNHIYNSVDEFLADLRNQNANN